MTLFLFLAYCTIGLFVGNHVLPQHPRLIKCVVGLSVGLALLLWCALLFSVLLGIQAGSWVTLIVGIGTGLSCLIHRHRNQPLQTWVRELIHGLRRSNRSLSSGEQALWFVPFLVFGGLSAYLLHTHILLPSDTGLFSAGVTAGDLTLHSAIVHSFVFGENVTRLEYPFFAGHPMGYPFLSDFLVAVCMGLGDSFRFAYAFGSFVCILFLLLVMASVAVFWIETKPHAFVLLTILFFLSGGLGFVIFIEEAQDAASVWELLANRNYTYILKGQRDEPWRLITNANVIGNLFLASRSACFGVPICLTAILIMRQHQKNPRSYVVSGALIGVLPMVHSHSFLVGIGMYLWVGFWQRQHLKALPHGWLAGLFAGLGLSSLQLGWIANHVSKSESFVRFHFGWTYVGDSTLGFILFWVFNGGPLLILGLCLLPLVRARLKHLVAPFLLLFIPVNVISFSPWPYDNIKFLMYVHFGLCLIVVEMMRRHRGLRAMLANALMIVVCCASGGLALIYEATNTIGVTPSSDQALIDYTQNELPKDATVLTGPVMFHPVTMYSGRRVVLGAPNWLKAHGISFDERQADVKRIYEAEAGWRDLLQKYEIDYIVVGPYERHSYPNLNAETLSRHARGRLTFGPHELFEYELPLK